MISNPVAKGTAGRSVRTLGSRHAHVAHLFLQMMQFAWQSYKRYAMGKNELQPLTKDGYQGNMFGEWPSGRPTAPLVAELNLLLFLPPELCPYFSKSGFLLDCSGF